MVLKHILFAAIAAFFFCLACESKSEKDKKFDQLDERTKIRLMQYMAEGRRLYGLHCSNCHQVDGKGLARLYPPLKNSDYLKNNFVKVVCGIRYGQNRRIIVNGIDFHQPMPANPRLTDLEIAEISTFVYNEFADSVVIITMNHVRNTMNQCVQDSTNQSSL